MWNTKNIDKTQIIWLIVGAFALVSGILLERFSDIQFFFIFIIYIMSYLILGADVIIQAVSNIFKGKILNVGFFITVATIAVLIIGRYPESVAVMLFYKTGEFIREVVKSKSKKAQK